MLRRHARVRCALVYGSRARGDFRPGSDIDVAIEAPKLSDDEFAALVLQLEEVPMVFALSVVRLDALEDTAFKARIQREGVALCQEGLPS